MTGYDVTRTIETGAAVVSHHDTRVDADGPWLIVYSADPATFDLLVPAHHVVDVRRCDGRRCAAP